MLRLDSTTRTLEIVLAGAVATTQPSFVASWSDATSSSYSGGSTPGTLNGTTAVTAVASPGAATVRDVDYLSVNNLDTAQVIVTIRYKDGVSIYPIITVLLAVGSHLNYTHAHGWEVVDSSGTIKTGVVGATGATGPQGIPGLGALCDMPDEQDDRAISYYAGAVNRHQGQQIFDGPLDISKNSSGQIIFPAVQNPSTGVSTLDDYQEGTWTPSIAFSGASVGITYAAQQGSYVKIGKVVSVWAYVKLSNKGSSTGLASIRTLPFTADTDCTFYGGGLPFFGGTTGVTSAGCAVVSGGTSVSLYNLPGSIFLDTNFTNSTELVIGLTYKASA